jgi:D-beta-D-heptose 7-phosphate kinase/D-beta-D-heptose 1-phosphate adenosyltransferase
MGRGWARFGPEQILVLGDLMLDRFIWGSVSRISPEAPVPWRVEREPPFPAGRRTWRAAVPLSRKRGLWDRRERAAGKRFSVVLNTGSTPVEWWAAEFETIVNASGGASPASRAIDRERVRRVQGDAADEVLGRVATLLKLDALIIEDYAKGLVTQELMDAVLDLAKTRAVMTVDPNRRRRGLKGVLAIKPNRHEAFSVAACVSRRPDPARHPSPRNSRRLRSAGTANTSW